MRWSLITSFFALLLLTSLVEGVFACSEDVVLESRARVRRSKRIAKLAPSSFRKPRSRAAAKPSLTRSSLKKTGSKLAAKLTAKSFKKSSSTYRKAALQGKTYTKAAGKVKTVKTPKEPPKGKDADHELEAQTVKHALHKGGISQLGTGAHTAVKDVLNHSKNMAFVDKDINTKKGDATRSALAGKKPSVRPDVKDYIKKTAESSLHTAKSIDNALKKHGIKGVSVHEEQKGVLKKLGFKREVSLDDLD